MSFDAGLKDKQARKQVKKAGKTYAKAAAKQTDSTVSIALHIVLFFAISMVLAYGRSGLTGKVAGGPSSSGEMQRGGRLRRRSTGKHI